ncbi:MAG: DUF3501 domain-containing protein [Deltaproteobacteria bacterium HGW-Deltaproteobacteria-14]|jgi:hypothetical protein|nr:MAG: DUF3501 domain-containing protein [Deltaproteobacteria bacterium HGW-Deltaproteobacteria-14]
MRKVQRSDIVDWQTYDDQRPGIRGRIIEQIKPPRRVHVGEHLTFYFENAETVAYQVQEMMRAERIVRDAEIQHEIDTYNELIGDDGGLGFTLMIEIPDPDERARLLAAWGPLVEHIYARLEDGSKAYATWDARQVDAGKLSSVHYMKVDTGGRTPVALGCDWEGHPVEAILTDAQRAALAQDLAD